MVKVRAKHQPTTDSQNNQQSVQPNQSASRPTGQAANRPGTSAKQAALIVCAGCWSLVNGGVVVGWATQVYVHSLQGDTHFMNAANIVYLFALP